MGASEELNKALEQLHDIEGLDPISWWPLAIGWWIVIGFIIVFFALITFYALRRLAFKRSWRNDTLKKLDQLEKDLSDNTAKQSVIALSEYLRRIALRRFSRGECAGLTGEAWLRWLTEHDPKEFDWQKQGDLLIDLPYAPVSFQRTLPLNQVQDLIQAAKNWVI